jgi:chaperone modulatory protein CbpM
MTKLITGILVEETTTITFEEVCCRYHIPKALLQDLIEYGLFNNQTTQINQIRFDQKALKTMETAFRLHKDLEINLAGVALALELLEEMDNMRDELRMLRKQMDD